MIRRLAEIVGEDRLSSLPECLLVDILSLLPIHCAVATSILSHRWRHLWHQVTSVRMFSHPWWDSYIERNGKENEHSLKELYSSIDHVLDQLTSPTIHTFTFCVPEDPDHDYLREVWESYREWWFSFIYDHLRPEVVEIFNNNDEPDAVSFPLRFFVCRSLVSLKIEGIIVFYDIGDDDDDVCDRRFLLPSLKHLHISKHFWEYSPRLSRLLFKSCPALERLHLEIKSACWDDVDYGYDDDDDKLYFPISCPNLKHLILILSNCKSSHIVINSPKLEYIKLDATHSSNIQFVEYPRGLLEADICICTSDDSDEGDRDSRYGIVEGISYARSLKLDLLCPSLVDLCQWKHGNLPLFNILTCLQAHGRRSMDFLMYLLHCPNLEIVEMQCANCCIRLDEDLCSSSSVPQCLSSKLKSIKLWDLKGTNDELLLLEYVLMNGEVLELLDVGLFSTESREAQLFRSIEYTEKLFSFQRSSKSSEITFSSCVFSASSKGLKEGSLDCNICFSGGNSYTYGAKKRSASGC